MPILLLLALALCIGSIVGIVVWQWPRAGRAAVPPTVETAVEVGEAVGRHRRLRSVLNARLDPEAATGLALTIALILAIGGGVVLGVLAYLVRSNGHLLSIDNGVAKWGSRHATALSTHVLDGVTQLGGIYVVIGLCVVLAVVETVRERSPWVIPFIVAVVGGEEILDDNGQGRHRPAASDLQSRCGDARAFVPQRPLCNVGSLLCHGRLPARSRPEPALASAAHRAVGRDCGRGRREPRAPRRALVSDVIAGLSLGWAWFAICGIAFGGRLLRFGATARIAARSAEAAPSRSSDERARARSLRLR